MKRALVIRHARPETLGDNYTGLLTGLGFSLTALDLFRAAPDYRELPAPGLPDLDSLDLVIILGGPLSANDDYPVLGRELAYIQQGLARDLPFFGVCLGAQLMARALGGAVEPTGGYQFGLRKLDLTAVGDADPVFSQIDVPLVPTLHGECFSLPPEAVLLAVGTMLRRDGGYRRINLAFRSGKSYAFQFEPQLTLAELLVWNRELAADYRLMGPYYDPEEEAARNLREFARYAPVYEEQMRRLLRAFLQNAGLA